MSKDPTPRADQLRQQREERYGHLQAKADGIAQWTNPQPAPAKMGRPIEPKPPRKLIPYAGKDSKGIGGAPSGPRTDAQKAKTAAKKARQRVKHNRRTELPPEKEET